MYNRNNINYVFKCGNQILLDILPYKKLTTTDINKLKKELVEQDKINVKDIRCYRKSF